MRYRYAPCLQQNFKKEKQTVCTNRAGSAVKTRRSPGGGCGNGWHKKWISLMGNGHLGAQGDLVDRAGDTMPMVPRYTQHAYITDRHEDGRQPQTHNGVNGAVERRGGSPSAVPEIRGAAA